MSIEDQIKEAYRRGRLTERRRRTWDRDDDPIYFKIDKFLRNSGYRLIDVVEHKENPPELIIESKEESVLYPEIVHHPEEKKFYVIVPDHGELEASDVEMLIEGYQNSLSILKYLESLEGIHDMPEQDEEDEE